MRHITLKESIFTFALIFSFIFFIFNGSACAGGPVSLPKTMLWSCYDVGSTGYVQASAIADAFVKTWGTRIRLLPSGTSIGRLTPVISRKVGAGFLANEVFFAVEGIYDFAAVHWGPQDLRVVLGHPATVGLTTPKVAGIRTMKDLKGKRVAYVPGADTLNVKMDAFLAFADLTWDDVQKVEFASYSASLKGLIEGKVDAAVSSTGPPLIYQLASSPKGCYFPPFPHDDNEAWKRMQKTCPFFRRSLEVVGPGITKENPIERPGYMYPIITVLADADFDWVYNFVKALDETYPMYKKAHAIMPPWAIEGAGIPPADAPFHDGAIKYLKEKGVWKARHTAWNNDRLEHLRKVRRAWDKAREVAEAKKMKSKVWPQFWLKERAKALAD